MGGWHIRERNSLQENYIGVKSKVALPQSVGCKNSVPLGTGSLDICPEFFHGFYRDSLGLGVDVGIAFFDGKWSYLHSATAGVLAKQYATVELNNPNVVNGSHVWLSSFFREKGTRLFLVTVIQPVSGGAPSEFEYEFDAHAVSGYQSGVKINRELTLASNVVAPFNSGYPGYPAYFSSACMAETTMTTTSGQYVIMSLSNTTAKTVADKDNLPMVASRYNWTSGSYANGFCYDYAAVDWRLSQSQYQSRFPTNSSNPILTL